MYEKLSQVNFILFLKYKSRLIQDFETKILGHFASGNLVPIIDRVFQFEDIQQAHSVVEMNSNIGKVLLQIRDDREVQDEDYHNTEL